MQFNDAGFLGGRRFEQRLLRRPSIVQRHVNHVEHCSTAHGASGNLLGRIRTPSADDQWSPAGRVTQRIIKAGLHQGLEKRVCHASNRDTTGLKA
ncbi:MAG: hypothetical protein DI623_05735 [Sphingomonas sanxanigenens]|uniref:Uncharacterized protein n=1 Tax=Sphingomonas sanxanigenens TaxID=397260 RepID=A0A2W5ABX6_9SPHN|nr:MAG: hypothetical protein DI623_05735 [Sphingomonas sanxanigenens]